MSDEQQSSLMVKMVSLAFFVMLTLGAFAWFVVSIAGLISQFHSLSQVVGFDKGSMYMLGCGVGLFLLTAGGMMQGVFRVELTGRMRSWFSRGLVASLVLVIFFPQLTHYLVDNHARKQSYSICSDASYHWLLYAKLYYTRSTAACNELVHRRATRG